MPDPKVTKVVLLVDPKHTPPGISLAERGQAVADYLNRKNWVNTNFTFRLETSELLVEVDPHVHDDIAGYLYFQEAESFLQGFDAGAQHINQRSFCPVCSQLIDARTSDGRYLLGHEISCCSVRGEPGCDCAHHDWPICDETQGGCGQLRPPKIETCTCANPACRHPRKRCPNKVLETDHPKVCVVCATGLNRLYSASVGGES